MNEETIEIGNERFIRSDIKQHWVDYESADERKRRLYYQDNHYIGGFFSLLIAGLVATFLSWKNRDKSAPKYLHIKTGKNEYCFSENEINLDETLGKLKK